MPVHVAVDKLQSSSHNEAEAALVPPAASGKLREKRCSLFLSHISKTCPEKMVFPKKKLLQIDTGGRRESYSELGQVHFWDKGPIFFPVFRSVVWLG